MKGCGKLTHVAGTNGGQMPCGATLKQLEGTVAPYFCGACEDHAEFMKDEPLKRYTEDQWPIDSVANQ